MKQGTRIKVTVHGLSLIGVVISASNYGTANNPNWYIQFTREDNDAYCYWKQGLDGGTVEVL